MQSSAMCQLNFLSGNVFEAGVIYSLEANKKKNLDFITLFLSSLLVVISCCYRINAHLVPIFVCIIYLFSYLKCLWCDKMKHQMYTFSKLCYIISRVS